MQPIQFNYQQISKIDGDYETPYFFTCAMISTCQPIFPDDWDNYKVQAELKRAKVIRGGKATSESSQMFVEFRTRKQGEKFIDRLNAYLQKKAEAIRD